MQLIYGGKTKESLPRFKFPESFSLSANPKHFSNKAESLKVIEEIILPYVKQKRQELEKPYKDLNHGRFSWPDDCRSRFDASHQQYLVG